MQAYFRDITLELYPVDFDREIFSFYQQALHLRQGQAALRRGAFEQLLADDDKILRLIVVFNRGEAAVFVNLPGLAAGELLLASDPQATTTRLPALSGAVFRVQP